MIIGIDLGGTRIKGVALDENLQMLHQLYTPTNDGDDAVWKNAVLETVQQLESILGSKAVAVGISAPGLSNNTNSGIACMPGRLQGLENFIWKDFLHRPTWVLNDAVAALVAEARIGAASAVKNAVLLTLGTGVGGAILIDGKPYQGAFQKAGHIGHMVIDHTGDADVTGMPGSLEECIGNCTIEKRSVGKYKSTHEMLIKMRAGDTDARSIWLQSVRQLAIGVASVANVISPEVVVIGGGIAEAGADLFEPLEEYMTLYEWRPNGAKTIIVKAAFGDLAGAIGAGCFARDCFETK
jgi:glucokinase